MSASIRVPLPESLAQVYERASEADKRKVQWLTELVLRDLFSNQSASLDSVVREVSQNAAQRGLTSEILQDLITDDE